MKLIIMTKPTFFVEEDKILTTLFEVGMDNLHLYKPGASPMYSERLLSLLPEEYYNKITVHDHFYLKEEYRLAGIHLDDPNATLPIGYKGKVGRTCTSIDLIEETKRQANTIFLRNIFDSISEPQQMSSFNMSMLEKASNKGIIDRKVMAWGGLNIDNILMAKDLGFGGVVICGDLWRLFDIHNQMDYKELINHFERLRKLVN